MADENAQVAANVPPEASFYQQNGVDKETEPGLKKEVDSRERFEDLVVRMEQQYGESDKQTPPEQYFRQKLASLRDSITLVQLKSLNLGAISLEDNSRLTGIERTALNKLYPHINTVASLVKREYANRLALKSI